MLVNKKDGAYIQAGDSMGSGVGGSAEISCIGDNCDSCRPDIIWVGGSWLPLIYCKCLSGGGICNMTVTITISINVGI